MCFAETIEQFNTSCNDNITIPGNNHNRTANASEGTVDMGEYVKWIILNPFQTANSNDIIDEIKDKPDKNVTGLIFETNQIISTNQTYTYSDLMTKFKI